MKFSKLAVQLSGSAIMAVTLRAKELKSQGREILLCTIGEPDLDVDNHVKDSLIHQIKTQPSRYGPASGLLSTREVVSKWLKNVYGDGGSYSAQQVVITPGSKFGLFALMQILCDGNDEVLIPAPYWVSYVALVEMAKAKPVICPPDKNYKLSPEVLKKMLTANTRILILNSPSNPTGAVYSKAELKGLYEVLKAHPQVTVICDDIYNLLIHSDEQRAPSLLDVCDEEFKKRVIIVHGVSKSYGMTGWRLGFIATTETECIEKLASFGSQTLTCVPDFIQKAAETALTQGESYTQVFKRQNRQKFHMLFSELKSIQQIEVFKSEGAFYIWVKLLNTSKTSMQVTEELLESKGLAVVPGESFGMPFHIRLSVSMSIEDLKKVAQLLKEYFT